MQIADRIWIPEGTRAFLFDMDGVLLDTLTFDLTHCARLLEKYTGKHIPLSKKFIRSLFAYHPPEFWRRILDFAESEHQVQNTQKHLNAILEEYNDLRNSQSYSLNPGIREILDSLKQSGIKTACVSNTPCADVKRILSQSHLIDDFALIVGNDLADLEKKPAPDTYLYAADVLDVEPARCVVIEDSLLGAEAGRRAGCFTIGVATGSADFEILEKSGFTDRVYASFDTNRLDMAFGDVTQKQIHTPNEFVSHMIEHIAWRICVSIDLVWRSNDWFELGKYTGGRISAFEFYKNEGAAIGMIDDGGAETAIRRTNAPESVIETAGGMDLDWFLGLRCEQLPDGRPLAVFINGLTHGLSASIHVRVPMIEDPHHSWEGVFRSVGIALSRMVTPEAPAIDIGGDAPEEHNESRGAVSVLRRSARFAEAVRTTAESRVEIKIDVNGYAPAVCEFDVSPSINVNGAAELLDILSRSADFAIDVQFRAEALSSSHVALEDIGLLMGRALKEILIVRMTRFGVNGAGSSVVSIQDFNDFPIRAAVSVEGRKFWKFVPFYAAYDRFRKDFLIGRTLDNGLFTEDLDDFIDGLTNGMDAAAVFHVAEYVEPDPGWRMVFDHLGRALKEAFSHNPYRKGVPPGVKATLA